MTTSNRSWLFVPADDERKLARGRSSGADAVILDLEDSVESARRSFARDLVSDVLDDHSSDDPELWVRVNPVDSFDALDDLAAVVRPGLSGVVVPKVRSGADLTAVGHHLDALEVRTGVERGSVAIMAVATEVPEAIFRLGELRYVGPRLQALTWGAEDLAAAVGALANLDHAGNWEEPFELVRSLALHAAAAAGAQPVDTLHAAFRDVEGLRQTARRGARHGFTGKLAIHPDQVPVINESFTIPESEVERAEAVIAAFAAAQGAGVVSLDGRMLDRPHLIQAEKAVARARRQTEGAVHGHA